MTTEGSRAAAKPISVLCVDDCLELVAALRALIETEPDMRALVGAHDSGSFLRAVTTLRPRVAIVDLTMPGEFSAPEAIRRAAGLAPDTRVIVYSGHDDPTTRDLAMEAGAWGFVSKHDDPDRVIDAVRTVASGGVAF